jgi:acyl-CoA thioesterase FadM
VIGADGRVAAEAESVEVAVDPETRRARALSAEARRVLEVG